MSIPRRWVSHARAEVCTPGAYRAVCVEFKTHHLAVCAIANAHLLNDLERGALLGYPEEARRGQGRGAAGSASFSSVRGGHEASAAFAVLRKLVNDWLVDATERFNPHADALLGQLRRWLLSDDSAMREPALRRLVELCVVKTFTLLLAEMKKLGATVVFADAQKVIVCTGKRRLANASAFVEGMRASLRKRELFSWLELEPVRQWHALLFRGPFDYGGLVASALPTASQWAGHDTQGPDDEQLDPSAMAGLNGAGGNAEALDMHWNVASFLPESLQEHFEVIVSEFIFRPWKREHGGGVDGAEETRAATEAVALEDEGDEALEAPREDLKKEAPPPIGREAAAAAEEERAAWLAGQVEGYFSQRVLRLVGEIQKHLGPGSATRLNPEHRFDPPARTSRRASGHARAGVRQDALRGSRSGYQRLGPRRASAQKRAQTVTRPGVRPGGDVSRAVRDAHSARRRVRALRRLQGRGPVPRRAARGGRHVRVSGVRPRVRYELDRVDARAAGQRASAGDADAGFCARETAPCESGVWRAGAVAADCFNASSASETPRTTYGSCAPSRESTGSECSRRWWTGSTSGRPTSSDEE